ncbi:hypothetical protein QJS04_geneDACA012561 [Acorus gramineus]|uniref:ACT domain-containing protein ACR n=1 Tax=Acorus gramineus TaxID=55184 RepID=A0AAV9B6N3_ACOGR|nr:hypothetical protein QJS04_geneDACA012561 [Acorus gramineus]
MDCWSPLLDVDDEYEKLVIRMNPPRVTVDNTSSRKATLVKVDSANKHGSLLEVVQVLTDLNLTINKAYISSDGEWFMDDQDGNKLSDGEVIDRIQKSLGTRRTLRGSVGVEPTSQHTSIELIGRDRPGLLSEVFAVLASLKCNVVAAEVWTHNSRMASVVYITDDSSGSPIDDPDRLARIKQLLQHVLKGTAVSAGVTHAERRLHQMMYADRDYDRDGGCVGETFVTIENCVDKGYSVVNVRCKDRPKLLFDTVCTLTDMKYVVFHAAVISEGPEAYQGLRLELCCEDRVGLLSDVTRIFRENGLSVTQAEVTTRGSQAVNMFYVTDASGNAVKSETIEAVRGEIGQTVLRVKDEAAGYGLNSPPPSPQEGGGFSLGSLFRTRSEKFLYNLGLIRSCS